MYLLECLTYEFVDCLNFNLEYIEKQTTPWPESTVLL